MKSDRELLELAAKAAGIKLRWIQGPDDDECIHPIRRRDDGRCEVDWLPLTDDGDALRLAVRLGVIIDVRYGDKPGAFTVEVCYWPRDYTGPYMSVREKSEDQLSATRRAIVRAAAAIGEQMQLHAV